MSTKTYYCVLCGEATNGAFGATGLRWSNLCRRCKDTEDHRAEEYVGVVASAVDRVYDSLTDDGGGDSHA